MSDRLSKIAEREKAATPGPWYADNPEDSMCMNAFAVVTSKIGVEDFGPNFAHYGSVVAITVLQDPLYALVHDAKWEENTYFIAHARADIPWLLNNTQQALALIRSVRDGNGWKEIPLGVLNQIEAILLGKEGGDGGK